MSEVPDDPAKKGIRLALEAGWMLAEAYAALQAAEGSDMAPGQDAQPRKAANGTCPETLTEALDLRSGAGSTMLLKADAAARELAGLLHLDAGALPGKPGDRKEVLAYTQQLSDSLLRSGDPRTTEAFRLGVSLAELMTAPADRLRARFGHVAEAHRRLELLADCFEPGVAGSVSDSLAGWKELLDEPSTGYMDEQFVPEALFNTAQADTAGMWKDLLFGSGLPIGYAKRQLAFAFMVSVVRPALKWGVPILLLAAFAFLTLRFLSGTGSTESRVATAVLALASLVAGTVSPLGRKAKEFWQKHYGQLTEATVSGSLIRDCLAAPVKRAKAEASAWKSTVARKAAEQERRERLERAGSARKPRGPRQAEPPPPASAGDDHPESAAAAGKPGTDDAGPGVPPGREHENVRLVR